MLGDLGEVLSCCSMRNEKFPTPHARRFDGAAKGMAGVGITFETGRNGLKVTGCHPEGPAAKCKMIFPGDVLVQVDGVDVSPMRLQEVGALILGSEGSTVSLGFLRVNSRRWEEAGDQRQSAPSKPPMIPKLWKEGETPRNEFADKLSSR
mmetsp:Transcript_41598/g.131091  ORF Transcript_41598/g.131091 Transcript_41598/m.131091 type:complete len:150 (-) Transcript_41598:929-1378(-)